MNFEYLIELSNDADYMSSESPSVSERIRKAISYIKELEAENERAFDEKVQRQEADEDLQSALDSRDKWFEKHEAACCRIGELEAQIKEISG